jgi:glycosyltransferase involved in cell wall biosynthesis
MNKLPITLAIFAKDNADSILLPINSVKDIVSEILLVDTGSTDNTCEIAEANGARIYKVGFTDFGNIRTVTMHLARQEWVLGLDSDEILNASEIHLLEDLVKNEAVEAWGLPRRRWNDFACTQRVEEDVYPDSQYRLVRNSIYLRYSRRVHEKLDNAKNVKLATDGPHIEHFHDIFKYGKRIKERNNFYRELYNLDIKEGIQQHNTPVAKVDEDKEKC